MCMHVCVIWKNFFFRFKNLIENFHTFFVFFTSLRFTSTHGRRFRQIFSLLESTSSRKFSFVSFGEEIEIEFLWIFFLFYSSSSSSSRCELFLLLVVVLHLYHRGARERCPHESMADMMGKRTNWYWAKYFWVDFVLVPQTERIVGFRTKT